MHASKRPVLERVLFSSNISFLQIRPRAVRMAFLRLKSACSLVLALVLAAGPVLQAAPAFASTPVATTSTSTATPTQGSAEATDSAPSVEPTVPPKVVRELTDRRTETATHKLLSDGTVRAELSASPIRFKDDSGDWQPIITDLIPGDSAGEMVSASTSVTASFDTQTPGKAPATLATSEYEVGLDMLGATEGVRMVYGDKTRYLDVVRDADLEYQPTLSGIKETIILKSAAAPSTFRFALNARGLEMRQDPFGGYALYAPDQSEPELSLSSLLVFDSSENTATEPAICPDTTMTVAAAGDGSSIVTYEVSPEWLADPARVFPIMVDPTLSRDLDTFVSSEYPTTNYNSSTELKCGYYDGTTGHNRAYVGFDTSSIPSGSYVNDTNFKIRQFHQYYTNSTTTTYLGRLLYTFSTGTTWNTQSSVIGSPGAKTDMELSQSVTGRDVDVNWDVDAIVQSWLTSPATNKGFMLYQSETSSQNTTHWRKFRSGEYATSSQRPTLVVNYDQPTHEVSQYVSSYRVGDTVKVQVLVRTPYYTAINDIRTLVNYTGGVPSRERGYLRWTTTDPNSASWVTVAGAGGYLSYYAGTGYGTDKLTLIPSECSYGSNSLGNDSYKRVVFAFKINDNWGDVQDNDLDTWSSMTSGWSTGWVHNDTNFDVLPKIVSGLSATTTASAGWFREVDRNSDGRADTANDRADEGRGSVSLNWSPSPLADGYRVYAFDGASYRKVGETLGNTSTAWSSAGGRFFPQDSDYVSRADDSWSANPYAAASPIVSGTESGSITTADTGAGVVVSDGSHLYYRAWSTYPGPTQWKRVGSGLNGTTAGGVSTGIGPDLASKRIMSAFLLDGVIYNGYATSATSIEGVPVSAASGDSGTRTLAFSAPLLDRTTGSALSGASANVLLAATDERIYSVAYNRNGSDVKDGFKVRAFTRDGAFIADLSIPCTSYLTDGVMADGNNLYFMEWGGSKRITKISASSWKITNQYASNSSDRREVNGCYDAANNVFWTGTLDGGGVIRRYAGLGLDLRDNPNQLYGKTPGDTYDASTNYWFRVVPYSEMGELAVGDNPMVTPTFDNRTVRVNDDPRHTTYDLGQIRGHEAAAVLDEGALSLDIDDLSIASWGPVAALSRHYDSASAVASAWAPGWVFNFEQRIERSGNIADYVDATGEKHRFVLNTTTSTWAAPNGDYSKLEAEGSGFKLTTKDRSILHFDSLGRLTSEDDRNGNRVEYNWNAGRTELRIKAANGQEIIATFVAGGRIKDASYSVSDSRVPAENRTRKIEYNYGSGYTGGSINNIRWFHNSTVTQEPGYDPFKSPWNSGVSYHYDVSNRLYRMWDSHFVTQNIYGAQWDFSYDDQTGKLSQVIWPGDTHGWPSYNGGNGRTAEFAVGAQEATVTTRAKVDGQPRLVEQRYRWNPTGTEASHTNKVEQPGASFPTWSYTYDPQNEQTSEQSPEGVITKSQYDSRGNTVRTFDGKGGVTRDVYNASDDLIRTTTPAGRTTYMTYDTDGNMLTEERVLTAAGERSRAEYTYDTLGRGIVVSERRRISQGPDTWAQTDYVQSSIAPNGEAQTVIDRGVKLSAASTPADLTKSKEYDALGNLLWEKDAAGQWAIKSNTYDVAGRLVASEDASATSTHMVYDKLGFVAETWREHSGTWVDRRRNENTVDGQAYRETFLKHGSGGVAITDRVVEHTFDPSGNEVEQQASVGTTQVEYNAQGLPTAQLDPGTSAESTATYDDDGNLTESNQAGNVAADGVTYDEGGNVTEEDPGDAKETSYDFDADGNQTSMSEPTDSGTIVESTSFYDVAGRLTKSTDAKGFVTTSVYDQLDRQLAATSGGVSATKVYNSLGWLLSETDLDGQTKTYTYDAAGRVLSETLSGKTTTNSYDGMGRILSRTAPDGSTVRFAYDDFGRAVSEVHTTPGNNEPVRDVERTFDDQGREVSSTDSARGVSASSTWNGETKASSVRAAGETTVTLDFDAQGREYTLSSTNGTGTISRQVVSRDSAGKVTELSLSADTQLSQLFSYEASASKLIGQDGAGLGSGGIDYSYNSHTARQTREAIDLAYPGAAADRDRSFSYDDAGRLTSSADVGSAAVNFSYTPDGRITSAGARTFTYRSETTRTQQLLSMVDGGKSTAFSFDGRGRRTGYVSQDESATYGYNDGDRLVSFARDVSKNGSVDVTATYAYDGEGQRTRSVVTSGGVTTATEWTYEGLTLLRCVSVTNDETTTVEYVNDETGRPTGAWVTVPGRATTDFVWLVTDVRGDVLELLISDGTPLSYRTYSAYGQTISGASRAAGSLTATQSAAIDSAVGLRFAGYTFDKESGLYYCSQRYYDPATGQWLTKDPARADGEESAYQYCGGDPVGKVDPTGEAWWRVAYTRERVLTSTKGVYRLYRNSCHSTTHWLAYKRKSRVTVYFKTWVLDVAIALASKGRTKKYGSGTRSQRLKARQMAHPKAKAAGKAMLKGMVGSELIESTQILKQSGSYYYFSFVYRYYKKIRPA